jgi:hypothetical protein
VGSDHGGWQHEEAISSLHNHHKTQDFKYIFNCLLLSDISNINLIHKPRQSTSLLSFYSSTDKLSWTRSENLKALHLRIWLHLTGIMAISSILLAYWLSSKYMQHSCCFVPPNRWHWQTLLFTDHRPIHPAERNINGRNFSFPVLYPPWSPFIETSNLGISYLRNKKLIQPSHVDWMIHTMQVNASAFKYLKGIKSG